MGRGHAWSGAEPGARPWIDRRMGDRSPAGWRRAHERAVLAESRPEAMPRRHHGRTSRGFGNRVGVSCLWRQRCDSRMGRHPLGSRIQHQGCRVDSASVVALRCGICHIKATHRPQNLQRANSLNSSSFGNSPISGWHPVSSVCSRRTMLRCRTGMI